MERVRLAEARYSEGWSQEKVAESIGVTRNTVSQWERGVTDPHPIYVHRLCQLYRKTAAELDLGGRQGEKVHREGIEIKKSGPDPSSDDAPEDESELELHRFSQAVAQSLLQTFAELGIPNLNSLYYQLEEQDMDKTRREFLKDFGVPAAFIGLEGKQLFTSSSMHNDDHLIFLEHQMTTRWDLYHTGGTTRAYSGLDAWLNEIEIFSRQVQGSALHKRSQALLSMSYQLQGSLLRDMMKYAQAHFSYEKALRIAIELEDGELKAASLARQGVTYVQQKQPVEAIERLEEALKMANGLGMPCLSGYILQALSEAHAMASQADQSQQTAGLAEVALERRGEVIERSYCQPNTTSVKAQKGVNAVLLGNYDTAIALIDESLIKYNPTFVRGRARLIAQKAEAYYGKGLIDICSATAQESLLLAHSVGSNKTISRVQTLHTNLLLSHWKEEKSVTNLGMLLATL